MPYTLHARRGILYTCTTPCPPRHTINHDMPSRSYHIICHTRQAISYTMPCPSSHTKYHAMPARPYHIPCYARQTVSYTTPCPPCHTIYQSGSLTRQLWQLHNVINRKDINGFVLAQTKIVVNKKMYIRFLKTLICTGLHFRFGGLTIFKGAFCP